MDTTQATPVQDLDVRRDRPRGGVPAWAADPVAAVALARREAFQLPALRVPRRPARLPDTWHGVALRLQAALWEVAARADIPVTAGSSIDEVARLLVGDGAISPPAGDAVRALSAAVESACAGERAAGGLTVDEAARLAERLSAHLALRARFG